MAADEATFYDIATSEFFGGIIGPEVAQVAESVNWIKRSADGVDWAGSGAVSGHDHGDNLGPDIPLVSGTVIGSVISPYLPGAGTGAINRRVAVAPLTQSSFSGTLGDNAIVNRSTEAIDALGGSTWWVGTDVLLTLDGTNDERTYITIKGWDHKYLIAPFTIDAAGASTVMLYNPMSSPVPIFSTDDFYHYCNMSIIANSLGDDDAHFFRCFSLDVPAYGDAKRVLVRLQMCATVDVINTENVKVETVTSSNRELWNVHLSETNAGGYDEGKSIPIPASESKDAGEFKWYELEWEIPSTHAARAVLHFVIEAAVVQTHPDIVQEDRNEDNAILWFHDPDNDIPHPAVWAGIEY